MQTATGLAAVEAFPGRVESGDWRGFEAYCTPDARFEATVPEWHFSYRGAHLLVHQMDAWFGEPARVIDVRTVETREGVVVEFERHWLCPGDAQHAAHEEGARQVHILRLEDGRIAEQRAYCAGIWHEETFARIAAEAPKAD